MIPRYRAQQVAHREKQILPLAVWILKLLQSQQPLLLVSSPEKKSTRIQDAHELITKHSKDETRNALFDFVSTHTPQTSSLRHLKIASPISELTKFSLLDKFDPDIVSKKRQENRDKCHQEFCSPSASSLNHQNNDSFFEKEKQQEKLISWYASLIDRPEFHIKQNLQQEVSLIEHARWVSNKISESDDHCTSSSSTTSTPFHRFKCIVDVGGGNGYLAYLAQQRLHPECETIVIDLHKPRHAIDDDQRKEEDRRKTKFCNPFFRRVVKPIDQVDWRRDVRYHPDDVLVISKHLCGGGLDQLLRTFQLQAFYPRGLCLSSCCHFKRLSTETYINPSFIKTLLLDVKHPWIFEVERRLDAVDLKGNSVPKEKKPNDVFPRNLSALKTNNDNNPSNNKLIISQVSIENFILSLTEKMRQYRLIDYADDDTSSASEIQDEYTTTEHGKMKLDSRLRKGSWRLENTLEAMEKDARDFAYEKHTEKDDAHHSVDLFNDPFGDGFDSRKYCRSQQKEGLRSLFSAITSRTNWVGTSAPDEIWMMRVGRNLEGILDAGRVEFLRNANNLTHLSSPYSAEQVAFVPSDVSPRNRVLLAWRRKGNDGYFLGK